MRAALVYPPFQENEFITFILGCGILLFLLINFKKFRGIIPFFPFIFIAFIMLLVGEAVTNLEALIWPRPLNFLEHLCYALNMAMLTIWVYSVLYRKGSRP